MPPIGSEDRSGNPPAAVDGPPNPAPHQHTAGTDSTQRKRGGGARDVLDALRFRNARVWTLVEDRLRLRALRCRTADRNEAKNANGCVARNRGQHRASPIDEAPEQIAPMHTGSSRLASHPRHAGIRPPAHAQRRSPKPRQFAMLRRPHAVPSAHCPYSLKGRQSWPPPWSPCATVTHAGAACTEPPCAPGAP